MIDLQPTGGEKRVQPLWHSIGVWQTDRQTDIQLLCG